MGTGKRVKWDQIEFRRNGAHQFTQQSGLLITIVDTLDHGVLEGHVSIFALNKSSTGLQQFLDWIFFVERHQVIAHVIGWCVQRYSQANINGLIEPINTRYETGGAQGDSP